MKKILIFAFILLTSVSIAQNCILVDSTPFLSKIVAAPCDLSVPNAESYCINIAFHIVRNDNGTGGFNSAFIPNVIAKLNQDFNQHNISMINYSMDYIDNSLLYIVDNAAEYGQLTNINSNVNTINCYLAENLYSGALGLSVMGYKNIVIKNSYALTTTTAHELAHCLRLEHTTHGTYSTSSDPGGCTETVTTCLTCGDFVCDTPIDANSPSVNSINIMKPVYSPSQTIFTAGQGTRMRNVIKCSFISIRSHQCDIVSGPANICPSQNYTYTLTTFGTPNITWSTTPNLHIVGSTGTTVTVNTTSASFIGNATITATFSNGETITKTITIGATTSGISTPVYGVYDWISSGYGNMGVIAATSPTFASYRWTIEEDSSNPPSCIGNEYKAKFVGGNAVEFSSPTPQAIINWGSCRGSYYLSCYITSICGGEQLLFSHIVDVDYKSNNPCYKNNLRTIIAPNPVINSEINIVLNKRPEQSPCNYRDILHTVIDYDIKQISNLVEIYDYNGNLVYTKVYDSDEFTVKEAPLESGNNYLVNITTKEGGTDQKVIIVE